MRTSLSEISTVGASFAEDVAAYAAAGFDAIGIWEFKLPPGEDAANIELLRMHGLAAANCVPAIPSILQLARPGMEGPADPGERIAALCASVRRLAAFAPESVVCLAGPLGGRTREEGVAVVRDGLRRIATTAGEVGVRIAFEPVHSSQRDSTGFVCTLAEADELLAAPGLEEVGVLFDTYHLADDPDCAAWLAANAATRVAGVHVSDHPGPGPGPGAPPGTPSPGTRVLPGEGVTPTAAAVRALAAGGWHGSLDVEIFSTPEHFWALPVEEAARRAHAAVRALG